MTADRVYPNPPASASMTDDALVDGWTTIVRVVSSTQAHVMESVTSESLPSPWFVVLHLLLEAPEHRLPMSRIARDLSMTGGGFTKLADRMASEGLIDRRSSPGDRRIVNAALTPAGVELATASEKKFRSALRNLVLGALTAEQLTALLELTSRLEPVVDKVVVPEIPAPVQRDPSLPDRRRRNRG